jgi:hypothetical protein
VIVDNPPGGGTTIGNACGARRPDGYTLLYSGSSLATTGRYRNLPYDQSGTSHR